MPEAKCIPIKDYNENIELLDYLMRRFGDKVLRLAYYYLRNRQDAEDIMQEAFIRVYENLDKFRQDSSYYTWIYKITQNLCKNYAASAYHRRSLPSTEIGRLGRPDEEAALFEAVEGGEIFKAVMDLPPKYRTVVALYYFENITTGEIAKILGNAESAVRQRLARGRKILKDQLSQEGWFDD